eukprot:scaffold8679_cov98-Phaeocystis_antarctica.AAC.2
MPNRNPVDEQICRAASTSAFVVRPWIPQARQHLGHAPERWVAASNVAHGEVAAWARARVHAECRMRAAPASEGAPARFIQLAPVLEVAQDGLGVGRARRVACLTIRPITEEHLSGVNEQRFSTA